MMKIVTMVAISLMAALGQAEIWFNEVMASNGGKCPNADGEAMDWVELEGKRD